MAPTHLYIRLFLLLAGPPPPPFPAPALGHPGFEFRRPSRAPFGTRASVPAAAVAACVFIVLLAVVGTRSGEFFFLRAAGRQSEGIRRTSGRRRKYKTVMATCCWAWTLLRSLSPCCRSPGRSAAVSSCSWRCGSGFWLAAGSPSRPRTQQRGSLSPFLLLKPSKS